ncbi:MAG: deoxycytidylate deaminase [Saprospiraceae bacterium]|jgi:deoxycytidylate deaminase
MDYLFNEINYEFKDLDYKFELCEIFYADEIRMNRCAKLFADNSAHERHRLGAGLYSSNSWLSGGANERRDHAQLHPFRASLHAEQVAIMSARCNISGSTLYVCRLSSDSKTKEMSLPCFFCMHQIINAGISKVIYTENNEIKGFKTSTVSIQPMKNLHQISPEFKYVC